VFLIVFSIFVFFAPNLLGDPANYIPANPLSTPAHIVPEWYFLPFYAILRAIPNKLLGVIAMFSSILVLFVLPWLDRSPVRSGQFRPVFKWFFWALVVACVLLTWVGANPPDAVWHGIPLLWVGRLCTLYYFSYFLILLPLLGIFETPRPLPNSIGRPVLRGGGMPAGARAKPMEKA
jgi:ubiquinol-cytochrome c reductase cytochrome b subunit